MHLPLRALGHESREMLGVRRPVASPCSRSGSLGNDHPVTRGILIARDKVYRTRQHRSESPGNANGHRAIGSFFAF